jgi:hypothetical protein
MDAANLEPAVRFVRLFPRLAMTKPSQKPKRAPRPNAVPRRQNSADDNRLDTAHTHVRARLLHMILENERVRRHEQRPNAS